MFSPLHVTSHLQTISSRQDGCGCDSGCRDNLMNGRGGGGGGEGSGGCHSVAFRRITQHAYRPGGREEVGCDSVSISRIISETELYRKVNVFSAGVDEELRCRITPGDYIYVAGSPDLVPTICVCVCYFSLTSSMITRLRWEVVCFGLT